jgi:hypothetical protein
MVYFYSWLKNLVGQLYLHTILHMVDKKKTPKILIEQIRAAILDGLYKPGERLLEADVAAQFHVSRSQYEKPCRP